MIICGLLFGLALHAQDRQKEINDIKKSKRYVYASATSTISKEEATHSAKDLLMLEVEQWIKDEKKDDVAGYVVKVKNCTSQIETQRGKLYRVFVYVAKKDVLPYFQDEEVTNVKTGITSTVENLAAEPRLSASEEKMLQIQTFDHINAYIQARKADGTLADCGKYATWSKNENVYLFVYTPQAKVCAIIKAFNSELVNMSTLQADSMANYKGCGAIWIKMNEQ